jgi:DNA-binding response OmpR family regulator
MISSAEMSARLNLDRAAIMLIERNQHSLDILSQIIKGFGAGNLMRCMSVNDAKDLAQRKPIDLIVADPDLADEDGLEFVRWLRRSNLEPNRFTPIVLVMGHTSLGRIGAARDSGANFIVAKPIKPDALVARLLWISREKRAFMETPNYAGPDRRFKFEGPPPGVVGRRSSDMHSPISDACEPNLSQDEIDSFMRPQKVQL